ncbi:heme ABC exporter ATP-binding protein CcmA [bacterium]|nr:heme ABC exporter ATP-binding protein CcmA [bacterium]
MLINIENLDCRRGNKLIIANVSLCLKTGECLILKGPNGSGKTTLLRHIAGLNSKNINDLANADIAYSGHLDGVKSTLTVYENLQFWAGIYKSKNLESVIKTLNLENLYTRMAGELSAGQKRRLGLARMLITNAKIWLMDEPTVSLDQATTRLVSDAISNHCQKGGAAIISTHVDLDLPESSVLDITQFKPHKDTKTDPFLEGTF